MLIAIFSYAYKCIILLFIKLNVALLKGLVVHFVMSTNCYLENEIKKKIHSIYRPKGSNQSMKPKVKAASTDNCPNMKVENGEFYSFIFVALHNKQRVFLIFFS